MTRYHESMSAVSRNALDDCRNVSGRAVLLMAALMGFVPTVVKAYPVAQQAYLKASNTSAGDTFGNGVAISGDTAVVGAPFEGTSFMNSGAAYVFVRNGTTWSQQTFLKASNAGMNDLFGNSVAIDGNTIVVGAPVEGSDATGVNGDGSNDNATASGAAYVFVRNGTTWSQQAYLKASNTGMDDAFGVSVAVSGDTIVVGADNEASSATGVNGSGGNNNAGQSGAAYVFVRNGVTWTQQAYLKASNTGSGDFFGRSVGVSGNTVVVGAFFEDSTATGVNGSQGNGASSSGAAYVFFRAGGTWSQQAYLKASNTDAGDQFGGAVAISGDTIVVAAAREASAATGVNGDQADDNAFDAGAAYVFVRNAGVWSQQAYVKASNGEAADVFGWSVAVAGDAMVIGAASESSNATGVNGNGNDNSASGSGAAYLFVRNGTNWGQLAYLKASNTEMNDFFGGAASVSGDTVLIGALSEGSGGTGVNGAQNNNDEPISGAAYLFVIDTDDDGVQDSLDNCPTVVNAGQQNSDLDGAGDACDGCVNDPNKIVPGACGCGVADTDSDGDGTPDCNDACPNDPAKTAAGTCGCGVADVDSDTDGSADCIDGCPNDATKIAAGICGCGTADDDSDGDGTVGCNDECPDDAEKVVPGACGCGAADEDLDGNGVIDCIDVPGGDTVPAVEAPCGSCGGSMSGALSTLVGLFGVSGVWKRRYGRGGGIKTRTKRR